jgi:hypothetical protein
MDYRITTHTNFSLNSRIIQLYSQLRTYVAAIPAILLGLTLGTSVAVFVACLCTDSNNTKCRNTATYSRGC